MNWECNSGRVKMSLAAHALLRQKLRSGFALSPLFPFLCPLFFTLFFSCTYTLHILLFQLSYPWPYLLKIHLSPSLYNWLKTRRHLSLKPLCLLFHGYEWLTLPCQMEFFTWLFHQPYGEFAWAFTKHHFKMCGNKWRIFKESLYGWFRNFRPAITRISGSDLRV